MNYNKPTVNDLTFRDKSKKHHPRGLTILHEDRDIIVVDKIEGLLTMGCAREQQNTAYSLLNDYVKKGNQKSRNRVFIVHRLDRDTSGVIIFAKSEEAKFFLQDNWQDFTKKYYAVVYGKLEPKEGIITSYLFENKAFRVYSVNNPDIGKFAKTGYRVIKESLKYSLLEIELFTGRKHQIRVHLSEAGHAVLGDNAYGQAMKGIKRLALHCASLSMLHPFTGEAMTFETDVPGYFKTLMK